MALNFYEDLRRSAGIRGSSDRQFGLVFALVFSIVGLLPLRAGGHVRAPALVVAAVILVVALVRPAFLHPLNRVWTLLGLLLGRIVNPVVTAILFFIVFTPAGFLSRLLGKDSLRLQPMRQVETYWIVRHPAGPRPETMSKQF